jgi:alpha-ketoglutarate-dependent taurine dioxygenase
VYAAPVTNAATDHETSHGDAADLRLGTLPEARAGLPLVVRPGARGRTAAWLADCLTERAAWVEARLLEHGALLLRGFDLFGPSDLERVARAIAPALKNDYLGTSPRDALTPYVFSASELPPYYPIPQHCEMSFTKYPPRRLFFQALLPNRGQGGETPLVDFQQMLRDLDPAVRDRFEARGVRNIRNSGGPAAGRSFDLWKLKRWDEMFRSTDRDVVEQKCRENGFDFTWQSGGRLRLTNVQPAVSAHPVSGTPTWFNHSQVFHLSSAGAELARVGRRPGQRRSAVLARVARVLAAVKERTTRLEDHAMHCTFGDGTPIPDADMDAVRGAIWKNLVAFSWQKGDVVAIDNFRVAHGRFPYRGPRKIAVCWA